MAVKDEQAGSGRSKLFRTKSIEQSIKDTDEPETKLRKELNSWDLTVFGVAVVIGAGIFTLTARTAGNVAGPSVSLAFVIAAIARDSSPSRWRYPSRWQRYFPAPPGLPVGSVTRHTGSAR